MVSHVNSFLPQTTGRPRRQTAQGETADASTAGRHGRLGGCDYGLTDGALPLFVLFALSLFVSTSLYFVSL